MHACCFGVRAEDQRNVKSKELLFVFCCEQHEITLNNLDIISPVYMGAYMGVSIDHDPTKWASNVVCGGSSFTHCQ